MTNENMLTEHPEQVRAFVEAFLHGLTDTLANPDAAFEISKAYVENLAGAGEAVQKEVLALSMESWHSDPPGFSESVAWENMQATLLAMGLITQRLDLNAAYTNDYLPE
jgi:NitT/TauT family transport system substrate-binding protein